MGKIPQQDGESTASTAANLRCHPIASAALLDEIDRMNGAGDPCIYIVDDERALADMSGQLLGFRGHAVRVFYQPAEALRAIEESGEKPRLLITDYLMGSMTGLELIARFKAALPEAKTLLISGTVTDDLLRAAPAVPDAFLPKPYGMEEFLAKVDELLRSEA